MAIAFTIGPCDGCCTSGGISCSVQCRSRVRAECCGVANGPVPATCYGVQIAATCNASCMGGPDVAFATDTWQFALTPVGPGATPGRTSYTASGFAWTNDGGHVPVPIFATVAPAGGGAIVSFNPGDTKDIPWGAQVVGVEVVHGLFLPFGCNGTICVQEWGASDYNWGSPGLCTGAVAKKPACAPGAVTRLSNDVQVFATGLNLVPDNNYTVEIKFGRRMIGSSGAYAYFSSAFANLQPTTENPSPSTDWFDVPNEEGFETIVLSCDIWLIVG